MTDETDYKAKYFELKPLVAQLTAKYQDIDATRERIQKKLERQDCFNSSFVRYALSRASLEMIGVIHRSPTSQIIQAKEVTKSNFVIIKFGFENHEAK